MSDTTMNLDDLRELSLRLAPELSDADFHILRHPAEWDESRSEAYAIRGRHIRIREHLRATGRWTGRWGSYIVFVAEPTVGILLHELAHLLPAKPALPDTSGEATEEDEAFQDGVIAARIGLAFASDADRLPWAGHDARFIRRCLHLRFRAANLGHPVELAELRAAGPAYALSMIGEYAAELGFDPQVHARTTFDGIESAPIPPRFGKLFARDAATFLHNHILDDLGVPEKC